MRHSLFPSLGPPSCSLSPSQSLPLSLSQLIFLGEYSITVTVYTIMTLWIKITTAEAQIRRMNCVGSLFYTGSGSSSYSTSIQIPHCCKIIVSAYPYSLGKETALIAFKYLNVVLLEYHKRTQSQDDLMYRTCLLNQHFMIIIQFNWHVL